MESRSTYASTSDLNDRAGISYTSSSGVTQIARESSLNSSNSSFASSNDDSLSIPLSSVDYCVESEVIKHFDYDFCFGQR